MANPFNTRATEFVKSTEAFLAMVTPEPISSFLEPYARDDGLYHRLLSMQGQPGSGKTTIARLFEFTSLVTLMRGRENENYSELIGPLQKCGTFKDGAVHILGARLPLESDYREIWQLPYTERARTELLQRLIQARVILAWFSQLAKAGITPADVTLELRDINQAPLAFIGGREGTGLLDRAKAIEKAVYGIIGALLAPVEAEIEKQIVEPYRPFDVIDQFRIAPTAARLAVTGELLRPLVILDDAHFLHPPQLAVVKTWLIRRELTLGRWILSRLDVLQPKELFDSLTDDGADITMPGITAGRDIIHVNLQSQKRMEGRRSFRSMTREMTKKYLRQMRIFDQNSITSLETILPERVEPIAPSQIEKLQQSVRSVARRLNIGDARLGEFERITAEFLRERQEDFDDLKWAMIRILLHRYAKRTPQAGLFPDDPDPEPSKPLRADLAVYDGARIHLYHDFERPYYVGFDALSDSASENAETFLRIASHVVEAAENLLIKQKQPVISPRDQQKLLLNRAAEIVQKWNFPEHRRVRALANWIAERCKQRTIEPNAPLGHGANAYGLQREDFELIGQQHPDLAQVLKFAVAYNAFTLVPNVDCKNKQWCLLELGGVFIVRTGLPFKRGGFIEGSADELAEVLKGTS